MIDISFPEFSAGNQIELPGERTAEMATNDFIVDRLKAIGLCPEDIHFVVCTHFDADHAGGHTAFPNAEFIIK